MAGYVLTSQMCQPYFNMEIYFMNTWDIVLCYLYVMYFSLTILSTDEKCDINPVKVQIKIQSYKLFC